PCLLIKSDVYLCTTRSVTCSLPLHDALPICQFVSTRGAEQLDDDVGQRDLAQRAREVRFADRAHGRLELVAAHVARHPARAQVQDRKSTRLNSSHVKISYAVFCLKKKSDKKL